MAAKSNETTRGPHKARGWTLYVEVTAINDLAQQKVHQTKAGVGKEKNILKKCLSSPHLGSFVAFSDSHSEYTYLESQLPSCQYGSVSSQPSLPELALGGIPPVGARRSNCQLSHLKSGSNKSSCL